MSADATPSATAAVKPESATFWQQMWTAGASGLQKGDRFDIGGPHPVLHKFLCDGRVPNGRALVPGCGRGYDVALLATSDRHVTGLDLAPAAVSAARAYVAVEHPGAAAHSEFIIGDFFAHTAAPYDFIFDYTFLCALPPRLRAGWAAGMARLVQPGGALLTLQFPLRSPTGRAADDFESGPPFLLTTELYHELLGPAFVLVDEAEVPGPLSDPRRVGAERWAWWQRRAA